MKPSGVPESFKVLIKELQSLGLDMRVLSEDRTEIEIGEDDDEETRFTDNINIAGLEDTPMMPIAEEDDDDLDDLDEFDDFDDGDASDMDGMLIEDDFDLDDDLDLDLGDSDSDPE